MEDSVRRILDLCAASGTPRNKLCRDIGIPPTTLSNYVVRGGKPSYDLLKKISGYFGVSMEYIESGVEPEFNVEKEVQELCSRISALPTNQQKKVLSVMYKMLGTYE